MIILDNSLLSGVFLVMNIGGLFFFGLSYLSKKYQTSFIGMMIQVLSSLFYFFIYFLNGDFFSLSIPQDFTANLIYLIGISGGIINALFGIKMYQQHRVVSAIIIQLGIFFSAVLIVIQLSDSAYLLYRQYRQAEKLPESKGFNPTNDFGKK
jgi:hypothetical protein